VEWKGREGEEIDDHRPRLGCIRPVAFAAVLALAVPAAWGQESVNVKEFLDRAQKKPQTEAVEDLIRKLKGGDRAPAKSTEPLALPSAAKVEPVAVPPVAEKGPPSAPVPQVEPPKVGEPSPVEVATPPAPTPPAPPVVALPSPPQPPVIAAPSEPVSPAPPIAVTAPPIAQPPATAPAPTPKAEIAVPLPSVDLEVHFDYRSAQVTPKAVDLLATLGHALTDRRLAGQTFVIAGHTDARGSDAYNLKLSEARAEAVRTFLIRHFAIAPGRLRTEGHGLRQLKNARQPFAGENRRVQVTNITEQTARP
jgi:outer membrane protein OmpA-like peptidoglycan-associated protein